MKLLTWSKDDVKYSDLIFWITAVLQVPLLAAWAMLTLYLLFLTVSAALARVRESQSAPVRTRPNTRFTILLPAHNEEMVIQTCLSSLTSLDYPEELRRIIVIADNCTDNTAKIAARAGATVYERYDTEKQGKGHALDWATQRVLSEDEGWSDALVIFDADTLVDPAFLRRMDERISTGSVALQARYDVLSPFTNWRTALLYSALLLHNRVRPLARSAMGWTTLLKGNGMCFARSTIEQFGWNAYSLTEDIEYTTTLLNGGIRVEAVPRAVLYAQAAQTSKQANSQRIRWEGSRFALARRDGLSMMIEAMRQRSPARLDWAMDLLIPPMAILVGVPILMLMLNAAFAALWGVDSAVLMALAWSVLLSGTSIYIVCGLLMSGADPRAYLFLLCTPFFLAWKIQIYLTLLFGRRQRTWVRTERTTLS